MLKAFRYFGLIGVLLFTPTAGAMAQSVPCSTVPEAKAVIDSSLNGPLTSNVAQSVPSDPPNCVVAYCLAANDYDENTQVAVGAGLSEALSRFDADDETDAAISLLRSACSPDCNTIIVTALAASQATTSDRLCALASGGDGGTSGREASVLQFGTGTGSGGGQSASGN